IEDRLERSALPVPAVALRMKSGVFQPLERKNADLFEAKPFAECAQALLERLQGRFGGAAVYGLRAVAEHRPEKAWAISLECTAGPARGDIDARGRATQGAVAEEARPLWLL